MSAYARIYNSSRIVVSHPAGHTLRAREVIHTITNTKSHTKSHLPTPNLCLLSTPSCPSILELPGHLQLQSAIVLEPTPNSAVGPDQSALARRQQQGEDREGDGEVDEGGVVSSVVEVVRDLGRQGAQVCVSMFLCACVDSLPRAQESIA